MDKHELLGPWIRRFLLEYIVNERNLSGNTQRSYRDALTLLLPFTAFLLRKPIDHLQVNDLSAECVRQFLSHIEKERKVGVTTRNQRLAAIHSLARFIAEHSPQHIEWCGGIRTVPFKRAVRGLVSYLEKQEVEALLGAPDRLSVAGHRNYTLLLFLYNSGARASEAANLCISDLCLDGGPQGSASVRIRGKGGKLRLCPLWEKTATELRRLTEGRPPCERVFLNRRKASLTRFGIYNLIKKCAASAAKHAPSLASKQISPHILRHSTATHLLRSGVDLNTIRAWLGHVSVDTTQIYAEIDLEMKRRALEKCAAADTKSTTPQQEGALMTFLHTI